MDGDRAPSPCFVELDAMIARAEAACERSRRAIAARGMAPPQTQKRKASLAKMEATLLRLRSQKAATLTGSAAPGRCQRAH